MGQSRSFHVRALAVAAVASVLALGSAETHGASAPDTSLALVLYESGGIVGGHLPLAALDGGVELATGVAARVELYTALSTTVTYVADPTALSPRTAPVLLLSAPPVGAASADWLREYLDAGGFVVIAPEGEGDAQDLRDWVRASLPTRVLGETPRTALAAPDDPLPEAFRRVLTEAGTLDGVRVDGEVRLVAPRTVRASRSLGPAEQRVHMAAAMILAGALRAPYARRLPGNPIAMSARRDGSHVAISLSLADLNRAARPAVSVVDAAGKVWELGRDADTGEYPADIAQRPFDPAGYWVRVLWPGTPPFARVQRLSDIMGSLDTTILGQDVWAAGSPASVRVIVRDAATRDPVVGALIHAVVRAEDTVLAEARGEAGEAGSVDIRLRIPSAFVGAATLEVDVSSVLGDDSSRHQVRVVASRKTLLTTDKPIYQPGQRMHLRSLTLRAGDRQAIGGDQVTFEVEDSKGNKVFKRPSARNAFGVASAQFDLAREVNMGPYTVRVVDGEWSQEKTVSVERYVLPKFRVTAEFDRSDYRPGGVVTGSIQAEYPFGKPVAASVVEVVVSKFDVGWDEFSRITGRTDERGSYTFELDLPRYFAGLPLDAGESFVRFEVTVTDGAAHSETITASRPVTRAPLQVVLIPETGELVPGVANEVYAVVTTPSGEPVEAAVKVTLGKTTREAVADAMGVARLVFTPAASENRAVVTVRTASGDVLEREIDLDVAGPSLLLRPSAALARVGDVIDAVVHSPQAEGWVYLDVIRAGQTVRTKSAVVTAHRATMSFAVEAEDVGTLELHAYQPGADGEMRRDTRLVHVSPVDDLTIDVQASEAVYRPGEDATVRFHVSDSSGHPVSAAVGVHVVDESVFARQEMQPGLERVFFLMEEELLRPKVEMHGLDGPTVVAPRHRPGTSVSAAREQAARVLFAAVEVADRSYSLTEKTQSRRNAATLAALEASCAAVAARIGKAIAAHEAGPGSNGEPPAHGLRDLVTAGALDPNDLMDPWAGSVVLVGGEIRSAGPDGVLDTADDVNVTDAVLAEMPLVDRLRAGMPDVNARSWGSLFGARRTDFFSALGGRRVLDLQDGMGRAVLAVPALESAPTAGGFGVETASLLAANVAPSRVREFFPETLFVAPSVITDEKGDASLSFAVADSITTWRMTSMASAMDGALGSVSTGIRVFQDFFIDLDLPVSLTVGDEVSVPVALYNYLDGPQTVRLEIERAPWFELSGPAELTVDLAEGQVTSRYFRLKAVAPGRGMVTVRAFGSKMADAVRRQVEVVPDGRRVEQSVSGRIAPGGSHTLVIPPSALEGSARMFVKIHPGVFSQVVEGLDTMLQMPSGCFEQTSSTTYPNILALQYMRATGQNTPAIQMKAQQYIGLGYQRLLSFEVDGGGFEWFGNAPANTVLTAYGLLQFHDMSSVHEVDPAVIARTRQFLLRRQAPDGSWKPDPAFLHAESWGRIQDNELLPTAYVVWGLAASGLSSDALASAVKYIGDHWQSTHDPYTLAILANALSVAAPAAGITGEVYGRLAELAVVDGDTAYWQSDLPTITHARGLGSTLETTAMAALALAGRGEHPALLDRALGYLVESRDARGTWHSTQATILALKALLAGTEAATPVDASVAVRVDGSVVKTVTITPEDSDVTRLIDIGTVDGGTHTVSFDVLGVGRPMFQVVGRYYTPWETPADHTDDGDDDGRSLAVRVVYDRTSLAKDDIVTARCHLTHRGAAPAKMVVVDLGLPPGFAPTASEFEEMVSAGTIEKYEVTPRQVIVYLDEVVAGEPVELVYRLRAKYPMRAKTRPTKAYEYYNPQKMALDPPVGIVVAER